MNRKPRDYRAEYQRRIARGTARGFTRSQARGHPKPREAAIRAPSRASVRQRTRRPVVRYDRQVEAALQALRSGQSLTHAARFAHVSPERLRRYALHTGTVSHSGQRWTARPDRRRRRMLMYSSGKTITVIVKPAVAREVGAYMSAVGQFLESNDPTALLLFRGKSITDAAGKRHPFETDPNALYALADTGSETFEDVYRIVA